MAKQRADRDNVTTERGGEMIALRLTPAERRALDVLIARQQAQLDQLGVSVRVGAATLIRTWIKREAQAGGCWDSGAVVVVPAPPPAPTETRQLSLVVDVPAPVEPPAKGSLNADQLLKRVKASGVKQCDLVHRSGISQGTLSNWISGKRKLPEKYLPTLAKLLVELGA